jgi:chemotaxis protein CheC
MKSWDQLKDFQLDVLREFGNIGAGNAATALSQLVQRPIDMKVPRVKLLSFNEITEYLGGPEEVVVAIFLRMQGDISGSMFFFLQQDVAKQLAGTVLGEPKHADDMFSEMEVSVLHEVGNILSGSYLSALADFTHLNIQPTVPALAIDMSAAILSYGLLEVGKIGDCALVIDTEFIESEQDQSSINGQFVLLPDPEAFTQLFSALGVPFHE